MQSNHPFVFVPRIHHYSFIPFFIHSFIHLFNKQPNQCNYYYKIHTIATTIIPFPFFFA